MKKVTGIIMVMVLLISLALTGCNKSNEVTSGGAEGNKSETKKETAKNDTAKATEEVTPTVPKDTYEITWYFPGSGEQADTELVEAEVNKYLKDKINATVKLICIDWGSWENKTKLMISTGDKFDIIWSPIWWGYHDNVSRGAFVEMNELLDNYAPKTKEILGGLEEGAKVEGKLYALPVKKDTADSRAFMFNKALLEKYNFNLDDIKEPSDITPWLQIIKDNEPDIIPYACSEGHGLHNFVVFDYISGDAAVPGSVFLDNQDEVVNHYAHPDMYKAWELTRTWYEKGFIEKEAGTKGTRFDQFIKEGNAFVFADAGTPGKDKDRSNDKVSYVMKRMTDIYVRNNEVGGSMHAISQTSGNPERAMMFLELMNSDPYLNNLVNYGIEGVHYNKVDENTIDLVAESGYNHNGMQWMFANNFINYLKKDDDKDKLTQLEQYSEQGIKFKTLGFIFNGRDDMVNEYAAIKNVYSKYVPALNTGMIDPAQAVDDFLAELEAAGANKVLEAVRQEYQEFLAK